VSDERRPSDSSERRARLAVDIGGTFTDIVVRSDDGKMRATKIHTNLGDVAQGVLSGMKALDVSPPTLEAFVHGTTIVLNALLEKKTPKVGLITTRGFRDVLEIMRTNRPDMYDLQQQKPQPLVPRRWRQEITERTTSTGESLVEVDLEEVRSICAAFREERIEAVAVCLLNSYANPEHERVVGAELEDALPGTVISLSSDLSREWREFERTSTTVINSAAKPIVRGYLGDLESALVGTDFDGQLLIMQSNGGVMSVNEARQRPVATLMSGPVGGVAAASELLQQDPSLRNVVTLDIGGTSADVAILDEGEPVTRTLGEIGGWPVMVPMVDVSSIGAGGGSIARVDAFGGLVVGPESAGAFPGPACYMRGGTAATVTDANLVLGRLDPAYFAGGDVPLDEAAARSVIDTAVASRYGLSCEEAAVGIVTVINSTMARLLWEVMIGRGYDPRDFSLLAFGGAGPLHACALAQALGITEVVVPLQPGAFSACGMITADIRRDLQRMMVGRDVLSEGELAAVYADLEASARADIEFEHADYERIEFRRFAELRYVGQHHPLSVEVRASAGSSGETSASLRAAFHEKHDRLYGFRRDANPVELLRLELSAIGKVRRIHPLHTDDETRTGFEHAESRRIYLDGQLHDARIIRRAELLPGAAVGGPCVVEEHTSTTFVPPECELSVDDQHNLRIAVPLLDDAAR
jgi:N-methylhydantoinase A